MKEQHSSRFKEFLFKGKVNKRLFEETLDWLIERVHSQWHKIWNIIPFDMFALKFISVLKMLGQINLTTFNVGTVKTYDIYNDYNTTFNVATVK